MPENNPAPEVTIDPDLPSGPLESRLSPDQIADLDEMNARVFGLSNDPNEPVPPAAPAAPTPPVAPAAPAAPAAPVVDLDEFTPPDDTPPLVDTPPPPEEFPDRKVLFPDDAIDKLRTEKAKADIRKMGDHYEAAVKTVRERDAEIENLRKQVGTGENALVQDLQKRNAELSAIVEKKALTDHPGFIDQFVKPRNVEVERAFKALEFADVENPKEAIERILALQGREKIYAKDELYKSIDSPSLQSELKDALNAIDKIDNQRSAFLADREGNAARIAAEEKAKELALRQQQETWAKSTIDKVFDHLGSKSAFFKKANKPGYEKWDQAFDEDRALIEELALRNENPDKLLATIALGVRASRILGAYAKKSAQLAERDATIAQLRGARPNLNGDRVQNGERSETPQDPNENLVSAARRVMRDISAGA